MQRYPMSWKKLYTQGVLRENVLSMLWRGQPARLQSLLVEIMVQLQLLVPLSPLTTSLRQEARYFIPTILATHYHGVGTPTCSDAERAALTTCEVTWRQKTHPGFVDRVLLQMVRDHAQCYRTVDPTFMYHRQFGCYCARLLVVATTVATASTPAAAATETDDPATTAAAGDGGEAVPGPRSVWCWLCLSADKQALYIRCSVDIRAYLQSMTATVLRALSYEHQFEVHQYPAVVVDDANDADEQAMVWLDATRTDERFDNLEWDPDKTQCLDNCLRPKLDGLGIEPIVVGAYIRSLQLAGYRDATVWPRLNQTRRLLGDDNFLFYLFTLGIDRRSHQEAILGALKTTEGDAATTDADVDEDATRGSVYVMARGTLDPPPCEVRVIVTSQVDTRIYCQPPDATVFREQCSIPNSHIAVVHLTSEVSEKLADHTPVRESVDAFAQELAAEARSSPGALVTELVTVLGDFASTRTAGTTAAVRSQGVACVVVNLSESYDLGEALSQAGVPYVICWTTKVNAYASVLFAKEFYHFCRVFPQDYRKSYAHAVERLRLSNVVFGNPADPSIVRAARRHEGNPSVLVAGIPQLLDRQERAASLQERWMRRMYHMQCSVVVNELKVPNCFLVLPYRAWKEMDTASTAAASASSASKQTAAQQTPKRSLWSRVWHAPKEMVAEELIIVFVCPVDGRPVAYDDDQPGLRFTVPRQWVQKAYSTLQTVRGKFPLAFGLSTLLVKAALSKVAAIDVADVFPPEVMGALHGVTELSTFLTSYVAETMRDIEGHVGQEAMASLMSARGHTVSGQAYRQVRRGCGGCLWVLSMLDGADALFVCLVCVLCVSCVCVSMGWWSVRGLVAGGRVR